MLASLLLASLLSLPAAESGSIVFRPATNAKLAAVLAELPRGSELEVDLVDAPPRFVTFVGYDSNVGRLVYRRRLSPEADESLIGVDWRNVSSVRPIEDVGREKSGIIGLVAGAIVGGTAGYFLGRSGAAVTGLPAGVAFGGAVGLIIGLHSPGKEAGLPIWEGPDQ